MNENGAVETIKKLLGELGISIIDNGNDTVTCVNDSDGKEMETYYWLSPLPLGWIDDAKHISSLSEMVVGGKKVCFRTPGKFLRYYLNPTANKEGRPAFSIYDFEYSVTNSDGIVETHNARFEKDLQGGVLEVNTILTNVDQPYTLLKKVKIKIYGDGLISFEIDDRHGEFDHGAFEDGWYLEENEMIDLLKENKLIDSLVAAQVELFPGVQETLNEFRNVTMTPTK